MVPHSSTLAWQIPWTEEPGRLQSWGRLESDMTERLPFHFSLSCIGEGNGKPLQCSCLENPRDGDPGGLPSMGLHRVGHYWSDSAAVPPQGGYTQHSELYLWVVPQKLRPPQPHTHTVRKWWLKLTTDRPQTGLNQKDDEETWCSWNIALLPHHQPIRRKFTS